MNRRVFLVALVLACGCGPQQEPKRTAEAKDSESARVALPTGDRRSASAESPTTIPRVALLVFGPRDAASATTPSSAPLLFRNRLSELGYVEGRTILVEDSYADGNPQRLKQLAHEIVASKPDVIVAVAAAATAAARGATNTIPIVMIHAGSPVESGMAESLGHPGGNVTGTTSMVPDLGVKQVELLRELMPRLAKLGILVNPTNAGAAPLLANVKEASRGANIRLAVSEVTREEDFDKALERLRDARPDALFVMVEPLIGFHRARLLDFAATNRLPASYDVGREFVRAGGLISYGPVLTTHYAIAADYVDKILKGAKPSDLPVHQPTQFALVINLKTAKTLGLTIPQSLLVRADEVIQ